MKKNLLFVLFILLVSSALFAQNEGNIWYFGEYAGLDFNSGAPVALTNGSLSTNEGCASISTASGTLRFYTDGITVWNNAHNPMPNGTGLLGDPSATQSGIIVPKPGSPDIYYVFTVAAVGGADGLRYSEVDMSLAGGLGDVTSTKNVLLSTPVTEKITAVKKANGIDFWVIAHDFASTEFMVYSVTSAGVNITPILSNAGTVDNTYGVGYLKASSNGSKLVQALWLIGQIDVLNFNSTTGVITNDFSFMSPFSDFACYGVEFSPDGSRLYVAEVGPDHNIYQYNMALGNATAIIASEVAVGVTSATIGVGALQIAPDGKIYLARMQENSLDCINNPNDLGVACNFVDNAVYLAGMYSTFGLPNFIQSFFSPPSITVANTCLGDTSMFSLSTTSGIDSVFWNFNDPTTGVFNLSTQFNPSHIFSNVGTYTVSVISFASSIIDTAEVLVTILDVPDFSIGNDTSFCTFNSIVLDPGAGYTSYLWQNSSTNQTFTVSSFGIYYVSVENSCGIVTDTIHVTQAPIPVLSINDITICLGQTTTLLANGATTYLWNNGSTTNPLIVTPDTNTTYSVIGTNSSGCTGTDTSMVIVNPIPAEPILSATTQLCIGDTLMLTTTTIADSYLWNGPNGYISDLQNPIITKVTKNTVGNFILIISNSYGCISQDTITVFIDCKDTIAFVIPNVFTPNGDNENQIFKIITSGYTEIQLDIFNRWGIKVFSTVNLQEGWDGKTKNGAEAPAGTYYYIVNATNLNGELLSQKGSFSLFR
jgi:gliding motility-associated-like protein